MNKVSLIDVSELITKGTTPSSVGCEFTSEGINFIKSESITGSKFLNNLVYEHIDDITDRKLKRSRLKEGDLLVSIAGAYLGKIAIVESCDIPANTNQAVGIVRLNQKLVDVNYVYYYFSQKHINTYINKLSAQSSQPNLNLDLLGKLEFDCKGLPTQQQIASVLSSLDSKIALNNRINAELEAMAKTLYDYWFVQFDFPNDEGKPYKSRGGTMVWNEELKREVPVGWEVDNLLKVSNLEGGGTPNKAVNEYWDGEISFYTPSDYINSVFIMKTESSITKDGLKNCSSKLFPKGSIFITARGTVGNVSIASENMAMNQSCYAFCEKEQYGYCYLFYTVKSLINVLKAKSGGSVFNSIVTNDIKHTKLPIPPENIVKKYMEISNPVFFKILKNQKENQHLSSLRDWLLPMLMNGQVKVGEVE
jgi:type I restriction enzyme, S subunit